MATKAEIKAQQAEEYAKWMAELVAFPGVEDNNGVATCSLCQKSGHGKKAYPMESGNRWLTPKEALESHQHHCWGAQPKQEERPSKAEVRLQKAADYNKWFAELVTLSGVEVSDGAPTCAVCRKSGFGKTAFPMSSGDKWLTPQQALESHQSHCWGAAEAPRTTEPIRFVRSEDVTKPDSKEDANADSKEDQEPAPDWREKAMRMMMKGVDNKRHCDGVEDMLKVLRNEQLHKKDSKEKDQQEYWRNQQLADRYGQNPRFHNGLDSEYYAWNRPVVHCSRSRSPHDRRHR